MQKLKVGTVMERLCTAYLILSLCFAGNMVFRLASVAVLALMAGIYTLQLISKPKFSFASVSGIYLLFVCFAMASCIWCVSLERSKAVMYELLTGCVFITVTAWCIRSRESLNKHINGLLVANFLMCVMLVVGCGFDITKLRYSGIEIIGLDKNYYSQICAFCCVISYAFFVMTRRRRYLISILPSILVILGSGSRKAVLAVVLGIMLLYAFLYRKNIRKFGQYIITCAIVLLVAIVYLGRTNPEFLQRIVDGIATFLGDEAANADTSALIRTALIDRAVELFAENPVLGIGMNNFSYFSGDINIYGGYMYAHNNYVELLADFGVVGFVLYYFMYILCIIGISRSKRYSGRAILSALSFALVTMLLVNDIASVSYYLKMYPLTLLLAYKMVTVGAIKNE